MPLKLVQASSSARTADIYINFTSFGRDDTRYAGTSMVSDGTVLRSGAIIITFNEDYRWDDERLLTFTAAHEMGHALGLSHSLVESAVMFTYYDPLTPRLHPDDKMGIHQIYGAKSPKWKQVDDTTVGKNLIIVSTPAQMPNAGKADGMYKLHAPTGQIFRYNTDNNWVSVDNNRNTVQIDGAGGRLYKRHADGSVYRWSGLGTSWDYIGTPNENVTDIVAAADQVYVRRTDGYVSRWSGSGTTWINIEQPQPRVTKQITVTDDKTLWILLTNGDLVRSFWPHDTGTWQGVNPDPKNIAVASGGNRFYKLQNDGLVVWLNVKENFWQVLEKADSVAIYAEGDFVYSQHKDGSIWRWTETQYVWEKLDDRTDISSLVGDRTGQLWALLKSGEIHKYIT